MWELDRKEGWAPEYWCFWTVVLEKTLDSPLDSKEIQSVYPKWNQSWIFIWKTDAEIEAPIFCPPDAMSWLIREDCDLRKIEGRRSRGWHHWMASLTQWTRLWASSGRLWWETLHATVLGVANSWTRLSNWTTSADWSWRGYSQSQMQSGCLLCPMAISVLWGTGAGPEVAESAALRELGFSWPWEQSLTWLGSWVGPEGLRLHFLDGFPFTLACVLQLEIVWGYGVATLLSWFCSLPSMCRNVWVADGTPCFRASLIPSWVSALMQVGWQWQTASWSEAYLGIWVGSIPSKCVHLYWP